MKKLTGDNSMPIIIAMKNPGVTSRRLPAEWEEQDGVLMAWPHADTDWSQTLELVEPVFAEIVSAISRFEQIILIVPVSETVTASLSKAGANFQNINFVNLPINDTWARDFGPITVFEGNIPIMLDFGFNGWGLKFPANHDNRINQLLAETGLFKYGYAVMPLILEGGSIESDGAGTLLLTSECLLNPNRNPHLAREEIETALQSLLGAKRFLWLNHGYLAGDDTDSHIDTLARLCPNDTILYVACDDSADEHFEELAAMKRELEVFRTAGNNPYRLLPLPFPSACYGAEGERLPATYANFLVINAAVLVPTYCDKYDNRAMTAVQEAFPDRAIIGIDCRSIILQHGSLHCLTMQLPKGVMT